MDFDRIYNPRHVVRRPGPAPAATATKSTNKNGDSLALLSADTSGVVDDDDADNESE